MSSIRNIPRCSILQQFQVSNENAKCHPCLHLKVARFQRKFNKVGKQRVQRQQQVAWKCNLPVGTVDSSGMSIQVFDRTKPIKLGTAFYIICIFSVMSNRPLRDGELFEIQIERMVERWSGSIEAGVTLIRQDHCVCTCSE